METQIWYLELTEEKGSHKFYEVKLENANLTNWSYAHILVI